MRIKYELAHALYTFNRKKVCEFAHYCTFTNYMIFSLHPFGGDICLLGIAHNTKPLYLMLWLVKYSIHMLGKYDSRQ
jgi:hypothetical protein